MLPGHDVIVSIPVRIELDGLTVIWFSIFSKCFIRLSDFFFSDTSRRVALLRIGFTGCCLLRALHIKRNNFVNLWDLVSVSILSLISFFSPTEWLLIESSEIPVDHLWACLAFLNS